jgi:hypothetical protein
MSLQQDGTFEIQPGLVLVPRMRRDQLLSQSGDWEPWLFHEGATVAWRLMFTASGGKKPEPTVLIVTFYGPDGPMIRWEIAPLNIMEGAQSRPEGKHTRELREWFERRHGVALPCSGDWGLADASHDPHNQVTLVVCNLREGFDSEAEWKDFRRRNG